MAAVAALGHLLPRRRQLRRRGRLLAPRAAARAASTGSRSRSGSTTWRASRGFAPGARRRTATDQAARGMRVRRLDAPARRADVTPCRRRDRGFGCGLPEPYLAAMAERATSAGVDRPRVPVRRAVDRRVARAAVAASAAAAHALVLVSRASRRRPAACCAKRACCEARDAFRTDAAARDVVWRARATCRSPTRCTVSLFCYANPALPALLDALGRRRRAGRVHRARGRRALGARPLDRRRRPACRRAAHARSPDASPSCRSSTRTRSIAAPVGVRPQLRARRGLVRARAMGRRSPTSGTSTRRTTTRTSTKMDAFLTRARGRPARQRAHRRSARSGTRGTPATRTRPPKPGRPTATRCRRSTVLARAWARALARQTDLAGGLVKFCESRL